MILKIFSILLLTIDFNSFSSHNIIPVQLNWETHFKGEPNYSSEYVALTSLRYKMSYKALLRGSSAAINFEFELDVNPEKSWVKMEKLQDFIQRKQVLNHEQIHVNMNYLLLYESMETLKKENYTAKNYKSKISEISDSISKKYDNLQADYDLETNHGINQEVQSKWSNLINAKINTYRKKTSN